MIVNKASGLVIDDPALSKTQGTGMIVWSQNSGSNQQWAIH
jgi:Ricin-type beta-trefoil lectin domain-like